MKVFKTTTLIALAFFFIIQLTACKDNNNSNSKVETETTANSISATGDEAKSQSSQKDIVEAYLNLKSALVNSDVKRSQKAADQLNKSVADKNISGMLNELSKKNKLKQQRQLFSKITKQMKPMIEKSNGQKLYKMHCPMAFNGQGADWYSDSEQIKNPYYGEKMMHCGKVTKTYNN